MKEIHKLLVGKLKPLLKENGFIKNGDSSWCKAYSGFSASIEIQKSQWSDDIYLNYFFFVHDTKAKPKKSDPYITGRIYGPDVQMTNEAFNEIMELSDGNVLVKTNQLTVIVEKTVKLISSISSLDTLSTFVQTRKFNPTFEYQNGTMTHNEIKKALGIE